MARYLLKRLFYTTLALWILITITFFAMNVLPGNPIQLGMRKMPPDQKKMLEHEYGYDLPIHERYLKFMNEIVHGNLGGSMVTPGLAATSVIMKRFPVSAKLGFRAIVLGLVLGLTFGIISAFRKNTWVDYSVNVLSIIGVSVPNFVVAALAIRFLGGTFLLPLTGFAEKHTSLIQEIQYSFAPTIALCLSGLANYARFMRSSVLEVKNQDYILTAMSKGVSKAALIWKHVIRNAILPIITIVGTQIATVITGSFVIEEMFGIPGIGEYYVRSVEARDYTMIMGTTVFFAFLFIVTMLFVDLMYVVIDPRIRLTGERR
jgi:oligopeptide transport system permease protein